LLLPDAGELLMRPYKSSSKRRVEHPPWGWLLPLLYVASIISADILLLQLWR
jgi:hypothetical protein